MSEFALYLRLGFEHISDFKGYDHILFVIALAAVYPLREWKHLLVLVTAFTIGHSVTLALATMGVVDFNPDLIETLIPVTIFITAAINVGERFARDPERALQRDWRMKYALAIGFGLIHGLGFSNFLRRLQTMELEWTPSREGDWVFHCHLSFHVDAGNRLPGSDHGHGHMAGLVMGISVRPGTSDLIEQGEPRRLTLTVSQMADSSRLAFRLEDAADPAATRYTDRGPLLELTQYQPTYVTVVNDSDEPTGIHWHGLELDAWADGVPGISASAGMVSPSIQPGESFTYKLTLMRPGTFMYHTHLNDIEQLARGLYGPIVVNPPDQQRDLSVDHTYIMGWRTARASGPSDVEVNGIVITDPQPAQHTVVGASHRLRLMNIAAAGNVTMNMTRDGETVPLAFVAKDGADLPAHMRPMLDTLPRLFVGETADILFAPTEPGTYEFSVGYGGAALAKQQWVVQ